MALPLFLVGVVVLIAGLVWWRSMALKADRKKAQEDSRR